MQQTRMFWPRRRDDSQPNIVQSINKGASALTSISILLEDQIRMVGHLSHLHDETKNVGIFIKRVGKLARMIEWKR